MLQEEATEQCHKLLLLHSFVIYAISYRLWRTSKFLKSHGCFSDLTLPPNLHRLEFHVRTLQNQTLKPIPLSLPHNLSQKCHSRWSFIFSSGFFFDVLKSKWCLPDNLYYQHCLNQSFISVRNLCFESHCSRPSIWHQREAMIWRSFILLLLYHIFL